MLRGTQIFKTQQDVQCYTPNSTTYLANVNRGKYFCNFRGCWSLIDLSTSTDPEIGRPGMNQVSDPPLESRLGAKTSECVLAPPPPENCEDPSLDTCRTCPGTILDSISALFQMMLTSRELYPIYLYTSNSTAEQDGLSRSSPSTTHLVHRY